MALPILTLLPRVQTDGEGNNEVNYTVLKRKSAALKKQ